MTDESGTTATVFWHTYLSGYKNRIAGIPRGRNPELLIRIPQATYVNTDMQEWWDGWDKADSDLKRWGKVKHEI